MTGALSMAHPKICPPAIKKQITQESGSVADDHLIQASVSKGSAVVPSNELLSPHPSNGFYLPANAAQPDHYMP